MSDVGGACLAWTLSRFSARSLARDRGNEPKSVWEFRLGLVLLYRNFLFNLPSKAVIRFSELVDLWVIKIKKPMIPCANSWDHETRLTVRTCERFAYSIAKITRFYILYSQGVQRFVDFFLDCANWLGMQTPITWRMQSCEMNQCETASGWWISNCK